MPQGNVFADSALRQELYTDLASKSYATQGTLQATKLKLKRKKELCNAKPSFTVYLFKVSEAVYQSSNSIISSYVS